MDTSGEQKNIRASALENRLILFGVEVCRIAEKLPQSRFGLHVTGQIIRASTSPAANYGEAQSAESRKDFVHKMKIGLKELREVQVWLRFILVKNEVASERIRICLKESDELIAIFVKSIETATKNMRKK